MLNCLITLEISAGVKSFPKFSLPKCYFHNLSNFIKDHSATGLPWSGKNVWKMNFFPGQGKVREFCGWPVKFRKVREKSGNLKINGYGSLQKIHLFCSKGEKIYFLMR